MLDICYILTNVVVIVKLIYSVYGSTTNAIIINKNSNRAKRYIFNTVNPLFSNFIWEVRSLDLVMLY